MKTFKATSTLEVDRCHACQLIWFDSEELSQTLGTKCDYPNLASSYASGEKRSLHCGRCGNDTFLKLPYISKGAPHTYLCTQCEGTIVRVSDLPIIREVAAKHKDKYTPQSLEEAKQKVEYYAAQWFCKIDDKEWGPYDFSQVKELVQKNGARLPLRTGTMKAYERAHKFTFLMKELGLRPSPVNGRMVKREKSEDLNIRADGSSVQYVEVLLEPGEGVWGEAGSMLSMDPGIELTSLLGESAETTGQKLFSAGKRLLTGESIFLTDFHNTSPRPRKVVFAAPFIGEIILVDLAQHNNSLVCQKRSFLCGSRGTDIEVSFQKNILSGVFSGEGFILQRLEGDGIVAIHACGSLVKRSLRRHETVRVQTGALVAHETSVKMEVSLVRGIKQMLFAGEGLFVTTLQGPGTIWLQTMALSNFAASHNLQNHSAQNESLGIKLSL